MENSSNNGNGAKVVGALLVGAAVGATLGVLFAPNKGSETRKKLLAKGEDLTDSIKDKFNEFTDRGRNDFGESKEKQPDMMKQQKQVI